ncbi:MAG TPA: hypothetical protein PK771_04895, partial [Spirochaetota bacterium]|nr:hypothetical protein [Spirochaetota bacterium]
PTLIHKYSKNYYDIQYLRSLTEETTEMDITVLYKISSFEPLIATKILDLGRRAIVRGVYDDDNYIYLMRDELINNNEVFTVKKLKKSDYSIVAETSVPDSQNFITYMKNGGIWILNNSERGTVYRIDCNDLSVMVVR